MSSLNGTRFPKATIGFLVNVSTDIKKKPREYETPQISMFPMGSREIVVEMVVEALERAFSRKEFSFDTSHLPNWVSWAITWIVYGNCYSEHAFKPDGLVVQLLVRNQELQKSILFRSCWNEWHAGVEKIRWVDVNSTLPFSVGTYFHLKFDSPALSYVDAIILCSFPHPREPPTEVLCCHRCGGTLLCMLFSP